MEYFSTSNFAREYNIPASQLFGDLQSMSWIERDGDRWVLTPLGRKKGGETRYNTKFGEYIVWPENISFDNDDAMYRSQMLNATAIGKHFQISPQRLNLILSELGWIEKSIAGWELTKFGRTMGGKQFEHDTSGALYVLWPESIVDNKNLVHIFLDTNLETQRESIIHEQEHPVAVIIASVDNFRDKFPANFRAKDGHMVRSRGEVIIDNALYDYGLVHAYERKLPVEEDLCSDFFIPSQNVYIEYWGMENDPKYQNRKEIKLTIYQKYGCKLIELFDADIANLDDHLPKKLLKFGIKVY